MIIFARGSVTGPDKLGPLVDDEMRVVNQLKDEGVMKAVYRRAAGPRGAPHPRRSKHRRNPRVHRQPPLVSEGLMTLE